MRAGQIAHWGIVIVVDGDFVVVDGDAVVVEGDGRPGLEQFDSIMDDQD